MPGAGGPPGSLLQMRPPWVHGAGNRLRAGAGLTAWRQRPAPVRCRAGGSGPGCRPVAASAPFTPALGGGPPARSLTSPPVINACAESPGGRPPSRERSSGLDKGRRPVSCPAIGLPLACPLQPEVGRREGSLVKSAAVCPQGPGAHQRALEIVEKVVTDRTTPVVGGQRGRFPLVGRLSQALVITKGRQHAFPSAS